MRTEADITPNIYMLRRILHVLALLQNNKDPQSWNNSSLADILSYDPGSLAGSPQEPDYTLDNSAIKTCIKIIKKVLNINIETSKGKRQIPPIESFTRETLDEFLNLYSTMVVYDDTRRSIIRRLIEKNETECMWTMAVIFFSSKKKNIITFSYTNNEGIRKDKIEFKPYHLIAKGQNIYALGMLRKKDNTYELRQYTLEKIKNVRVTERVFNDTIPDASQFFKYSISPFIEDPVEIRIKYNSISAQEIRQILGILGEIEQVAPNGKKLTPCEITEYNMTTHFEAVFKISDYQHLMKHLFFFGRNVEILEPTKIREEMKQKLRDGLSAYKD